MTAPLTIFIVSMLTFMLVTLSLTIQNVSRVTQRNTLTVSSFELCKSILNLVKSDLSEDLSWNDCNGVNKNCEDKDENGYYYFYSTSLEKTLKGYSLNKGNSYVKIKPVNANRVKVIVSAGYGDKGSCVIGAEFERGGGINAIPLIYGASTNVNKGTLCSLLYLSDDVPTKVTNPRFTIYLQDDFYWSPEIYVPPSWQLPENAPEKKVTFVTNFDTQVKGYDEIDNLISTGDVYVLDGANLREVYSNGDVYVSSDSNVDQVIEHGNFEYPNLRKELEDNPPVSGVGSIIYCGFLLSPRKVEINAPQVSKVYVGPFCDEIDINVPSLTVGTIYAPFSAKFVFKNYGSDKVSRLTFGSFYIVPLSFENSIIVRQDLSDGNGVILKGERLYNSRGSMVCSPPENCLLDVNYLYQSDLSSIIGFTGIVRVSSRIDNSQWVGNLFAEKLDAYKSVFCNLIDKNGNQIVYDAEDFYNIIFPNGVSLPTGVVSLLNRVVCANEEDCVNKL